MILLLISTLCLHSVLGGQQVGHKVSSIKQHFNNSSVERQPWLISILDGDKHKCSGSIISSSLILTSAYCTLHPKKSLIVEVNHGNGKKSQHRVVTTKRHEQYNEADGGTEHDIALLKVSPLIKFDSNVINIILSEKEDYIVPNTIVTSAGLPPTTNNGTEEMSSIKLRVLRINDCPRHVSAKKDTVKGLFCAGRWSGDVCQGDAGGPIFIAGVQVGIISWNAGCVPRLYIDVAYYSNWIKASLGKLNYEESTVEYIEDISKTYLLPLFWPFSH